MSIAFHSFIQSFPPRPALMISQPYDFQHISHAGHDHNFGIDTELLGLFEVVSLSVPGQGILRSSMPGQNFSHFSGHQPCIIHLAFLHVIIVDTPLSVVILMSAMSAVMPLSVLFVIIPLCCPCCHLFLLLWTGWTGPEEDGR